MTQKTNEHRFFIRDCIRDYTKLEEGRVCPRSRSLDKANIDSSNAGSGGLELRVWGSTSRAGGQAV